MLYGDVKRLLYVDYCDATKKNFNTGNAASQQRRLFKVVRCQGKGDQRYAENKLKRIFK